MKKVQPNKARGCLIGVAVGDAIGMPVESMSREEILAATKNEGVKGFLPPLQTRISDTRNLPSCSTTDDTRLTIAVAQSLIDCRGFRIEHQGAELVRAVLADPERGYGAATRRAVKELDEYFVHHPFCQAGRSPVVPAPEPEKLGKSCGNGVAMKVAPLALFRAARPSAVGDEHFLNDVMALGLQTHGDPRASFAAAVVGLIIMRLAVQPKPLAKDRLVPYVRKLVTRTLKTLEFRYQFYRDVPKDRLSKRFETLWECLGDKRLLRSRIGTSCFALESVPLAVGIFLRHPTDLKRGLLEAANMGGDTDTVASIVGSLIGANVGETGLPLDWVCAVQYTKLLADLADELLEAAAPL